MLRRCSFFSILTTDSFVLTPEFNLPSTAYCLLDTADFEAAASSLPLLCMTVVSGIAGVGRDTFLSFRDPVPASDY